MFVAPCSRRAIRQPRHRVERNHIHNRRPPPQQPRQFMRVLRTVVDPRQQHILKRQLPPREIKIVIRLGQDLRQRNLFAHRHNLPPDRFVRRVQRHRQPIPRPRLRQPPHRLRQPHGRNRDPPCTDPQPILAARLFQRRQQVVQVRQRLAHPHHHNVAQPLLGLAAAAAAAESAR